MSSDVGLSSLFRLSSHPHAVLAELQQAGIISNEECKEVVDIDDVVEVQSSKSPEVQTKTSEILTRLGLAKEYSLFAGKQTHSLFQVPVVCCTVEPSCKGHLKTSIIIVSFTHTMLGHSE